MTDNSGNLFRTSNDPRVDESALRRLRMLVRIAIVWGAVIVLRLIHLQVISHDDYKRMAQAQQERRIEIPAPRGAIYDRDERPLAMSLARKSVCINPMLVPDIQVTAEILARVLNLDAGETRDRLELAVSQGRGFLWVKRKVSMEEYERAQALKLLGVEFRDETARHYPKGSLASHVLGGVNHEERGNGGIELGLEEELEGIPGMVRLLKDVKERGVESRIESQPQPGKSITLTIDERVQFVAERELKKAAENCRCKSGSVVVMHPATGDILAMASWPTYDPNVPVQPGEELSSRLNLAVSAPFEPGSVFKVITIAAALETTRLQPGSPVNCLGGTINLYGRVIHEAKRGFGVIPMRTVLAKSSNIGAIQVGIQVGPQRLWEYIRRFGFGERSGLPLPAESPGQVFEPRRWSKVSIGSVAMGHEITTTTLQLAQAASVIANNGMLIRPRVVLKRQRPGEKAEVTPVAEPVQVLQAENAWRMREMMEDVVLPGGTGTRAQVGGYRVGGKTGSAQIYDFKLKQYTHKYNASFLGMAPLHKPSVVVVVTLNGSSEFGGVVATPVFKEVAAAALRILDVPKDREETLLPTKAAKTPAAVDPDADNDAAIAGVGQEPAAEPAAEAPPPPAPLLPDAPVLSASGAGLPRKPAPAGQQKPAPAAVPPDR